MKKIISFGLLLAVLIAGCKKEPESEYDLWKFRNSGTMTAMLNGKPWKGDIVLTSIYEDRPNRVYIVADLFTDGRSRQGLSIGNIELINKKQDIYNSMRWTSYNQTSGHQRGIDTCTASYSMGNYDVAENVYGVLENEDNFIEINNYNSSSPSLSGTFKISFYRLNSSVYPQTQGLPDTLRFTDGRIDVQIMKYD